MQIAQALSGYSLGEADMLRRAMGKKIKKEMDAQRAEVRRRRGRARDREGQGRRDLRSSGEVRRLRLQQEPRGGLCADRLLDRLVQGEPPGRVRRRLDDPRQGQHRQARRVPRRSAEARDQGRAALGQRIRCRLRRARRRRRRRHDRIRALRHQGGGRSPGGGPGEGARRKPFASLADMARRLDPRLVNKKALEKSRRGRGVRRTRAGPRRRLRFGRADAGDRQSRRVGKGLGPERPVRRGRGHAPESQRGAVDGGREAQARVRRRWLLLVRPSA